MSEQRMAREMTPQERAEQLYGSLTCTTYREGYQDPDNDIALIADVLQQTRRAALLEAIKCLDDTAHEGSDVGYVALTKLAQEGA